MPGPFVLTFLGKIGEIVLGKVGEHVVVPIQQQFKYMCCFDSNIKELEFQLEMLQGTRQGVQMRVDNDRANVRIINRNVEAWLKSANDLTSEVALITQKKPKVKEGCLNGWCPNLKLRYSLSRKAVKNTEVVIKLQAAGVFYTPTAYSLAPTSMETIPNEQFTWLKSQSLTMDEIIKALKHNEINLIGICGLGGTGKTTMVLEVAKGAKEVYHFEEVAMAVVSQEPNLTNVQACIANMLGLELGDRDSPKVRAALLHKRLLQDNKKVLVILDDVWVEFDLQDMGIPLEGANKNFKMLYTSRTRDLWHDVQTKKEISLELLSEDEAWHLFREKAGDLADARDLRPIAKQIVYQCGRLPLALVHIGSALSKKSGGNASKDKWEGVLDRLTCASGTSADHQLSHLELTYIVLEDMEARHLFLLCCLFQGDEDIRIEDLVRYGFGLSLFDGINEMAEVRRRVFLIVNDLKSRYLLLDSEEEECVKVQDLVRDLGISIASKEKFALVSHGAVSEWPNTDTHEHYPAISVILEKIKELPKGLMYPNLKFLMLRCHKLENVPPNFFEGMGNLKVLELKNFQGIITFQPLKNLTTLALEGFCMLDNVCAIGDLSHLEILNFRDSGIKVLPEEIKKLNKLRSLDVRGTASLERIPPGVVSCLVSLEELYVIPSRFCHWEGEGQEKGRNANLEELKSLLNLNTLEIMIQKHVVVPKLPILRKLKKYKVIQEDLYKAFKSKIGNPYERQLMISECNWDTPAGRGGIDMLLRSSDCLILTKGSIEVVFELEGADSNEPNPELLSSLKVVELLNLPRLNYISKRDPMGFKYTQTLEIYGCDCLTYVFAPTMPETIPQLRVLKIQRCKMLSRIVAEKNGLGEISVDEVKFPRLERLELIGLPNLERFCSSTHPLELPELTKINISFCPRADALFSFGQVTTPKLSSSGILWNGNLINAIQRLQENGDDPMATSMEKPRTLDYVTNKSKSWHVAETQCQLVAMPERIERPHKVARLLYTNSGNGVLALGCNGSMRLWKWGSSKHNPSGKATASVVPQQWQPASGLAVPNDLTGAKLEEVVPCIALSENDSYVISACGGEISLFNMMTFKVMTTFMPPPIASTFLAFYPQDNNVIAIGMEDSTIRIYNVSVNEEKSKLEGHQKRITGLAFSTDLNILVSSGADAQLCSWRIDTWKKLKSVSIQLPAAKARSSDPRVQFHSNQIILLVSQETQLTIYDASEMQRIRQWVPHDDLPAPISCATYSCDSQLVYVSFCDGKIGVFDADSLTVLCRIEPSKYLSPALLSGTEDVYPLVVAAHPQLPNQFAIGSLTDGSVIVMEMEPPTITGQDGGTASSSNANDQTLDQKRKRVEEEEKEKKGKAPISG